MAKTCVFDAYGTLFDVAAAAREAASQPENADLATCWQAIARDWRLKQLQYTWLRAVMREHCDFWQVTQDGLDWAMEAAGLSDGRLRQVLLDLYWELSAYPEVPKMLATLKDTGHDTAILSNGSMPMLQAAVKSAGIGNVLDDVLSVETVGIFKPDVRVYDLVGKRFGSEPGNVLFVSSNGWDAAAGAHYGFETVWVNRMGEPRDRLWTPQHELNDLTDIPKLAEGGA